MTARTVYLDGRRVHVDPAAHIGAGGEADVFDLGNGQALKLFKGPDHPDVAGDQAQQCAALQRLHVHQRKLADFPGADLPDRVIGPRALATEGQHNRQIIGYSMDLVTGAEHLYRYAEPRFRRRAGATLAIANQIIDTLVDLQDTVEAIHAAGVTIGDFNDLNVLVRDRRAYIIDADSFQYGAYACRVFTARFIDPLLCRPGHTCPTLAGAYGPESDWYAFAVMVMRSLLCVGPYGGVYRPARPSQRIAHAHRPLARKTVFDDDVIYPKPALHYSRLPDDLLDYLHATFVADARGAPPVDLLRAVRFTRCLTCGGDHARARCPDCTTNSAGRLQPRPVRERTVHGRVQVRTLVDTADGSIVAAAVQAGELRWLLLAEQILRNRHGQVLQTASARVIPQLNRAFLCHGDGGFVAASGQIAAFMPDIAQAASQAPAYGLRVVDAPAGDCAGLDAFASNGERIVWLQGGQLHTLQGVAMMANPMPIGQVVRRQTRIWLGPHWGFGLYRAGRVTVGFRFRPDARGIDDNLTMPRMGATASDWHVEIGDDRLWLWWTEQGQGQRILRCACVHQDGRLLGSVSLAEHDLGKHRSASAQLARWLPFARGGCAVGSYLFVPTDDGIVRVERHGARLGVTRAFPDTAPFVDASNRLLAGQSGLYAVAERHIIHLTMN